MGEGKKRRGGGKAKTRLGRTATGERIAFVSARPRIIHEHFYQFSSRATADRSWTRRQDRWNRKSRPAKLPACRDAPVHARRLRISSVAKIGRISGIGNNTGGGRDTSYAMEHRTGPKWKRNVLCWYLIHPRGFKRGAVVRAVLPLSDTALRAYISGPVIIEG